MYSNQIDAQRQREADRVNTAQCEPARARESLLEEIRGQLGYHHERLRSIVDRMDVLANRLLGAPPAQPSADTCGAQKLTPAAPCAMDALRIASDHISITIQQAFEVLQRLEDL